MEYFLGTTARESSVMTLIENFIQEEKTSFLKLIAWKKWLLNQKNKGKSYCSLIFMDIPFWKIASFMVHLKKILATQYYESYLLIFGISPSILNYLHASFWLKTPKFKQQECTSNWNKMCCLTLVKILWDCTDQQMVRLFRWPSKIGKGSELECLKLLRQRLITTKGNLFYWKISKWKNKRIYDKRVHHLFNSLLDHWWISAFKLAQSLS